MTDLENRVAAAIGRDPTAVTALVELEGGMIGRVVRAELAEDGSVVAKTGPTPLSVEARMLRALSRAGLAVPEVYHASDDLLVMEHVEGRSEFTPAAERDAADRLARLHAHDAEAFGFPFDTLTGLVRQPNPWTDSWIEFFGEHRLRHVAGLAREGGELSVEGFDRVVKLVDDLDALLSEPDSPSLIHGDVWTTNVLADGERVRAFLDPATYYAHPEVELAYIRWTGTFGEPFFERYRELRGVDPGFEERYGVYVCYPLLVHVHLFGGRYGRELDRTLGELGY
jgi:fructosamine-3-kinase